MKRNYFLRWTWGLIIRPYIKEINGLKNLPKKGPYIIVANHSSVADDFLIIYLHVKNCSKSKFGAIARFRSNKKSIFQKIVIHTLKIYCNSFFAIISALKKNIIQKSVKVLKQGNVLLVFPEGYHATNELLKAKTGAIRIALEAKVPIIPIGLINADKVLPKNAYLPRFRRVTINIGKKYDISKYYGKQDDRKIVNELTRIMMKKVAKLCNKEYNY
ncbi:MAG: lysophospholipid acyltransferase family protein [Nanoarchaeota archaeon]